MFKHILVPLDGSRLAEAALPAATYVAQTCDAPVTLLHIVERHPPGTIHGEHHLAGEDEARAYLEEIAARAFPPGVTVDLHVHTAEETGQVPRSIAEHAGEMSSDLIVLCAHGRGGLRGLLFGRIAQQVIAQGGASVLVVQPTETGEAPAFACHRVLVPLDGNPDHEQGLPVVRDLIRVCGAALHLVMVVPTLGTLSGPPASAAMLMPGATSAMLDMSEEEAAAYLERQALGLQQAGLSITAEVARGDPADVIADTAQRINADLIVLSTHGKTGMDAFWSGSLTPRVSSRAGIPTLLVRVEGPGADPLR